ncbi:MAG: rhomboid family intramembrane serine protease [Promicromonosporaceae bacterium]|nr:rhomboid family intramembrane serine protease [Promicromonosporaceae bacterium]
MVISYGEFDDTPRTPVCPRHPDRAAYVRCQRCGRPACPDCQRQAAVGIQCVDCVATAKKAARPAKTALGGRARIDEGPKAYLVTYTLIGICVAMFVLQLAVPGFTELFYFEAGDALSQPWRFLTAAFLHSTSFYGHILFNMYALYISGSFLEPVLGRARFVALCLLSAVGGSVGVALLTSPLLLVYVPTGELYWWWGPPVVGASGMVFGLFGAMVAVLRRFGANYAQMIVLIAINTVIGFAVPGIAWQAHLGGLAVGFAIGWGFSHATRERQKTFGWLLPVSMSVLLLAVTLVRFAFTPTGLASWV